MPEELIKKWKSSILPQWKTCFLTAWIVGLIAHLYKITNWLPNWDSLVFRYDEQNMLAMGRWFLPVASAPSSFYDLPWLTGLLAILFYALGAVCICKMFGIQKHITAALIGAAVISFPNVTSVLLYNYVADAYAFSFLLACVAAYLLIKRKPNYVLVAISIALSVGIYQAYITVTIMLLLCHLIVEGCGETDVKGLLGKSVRFLLGGILGMGLYYLVMQALLKLTGTTLLEYQGFSEVGTGGINIWASLYTIKESFVRYFFDFSNGIHIFGIVNVIILIATVIFYVIDIVKAKKGIGQILVLGVFVILLPIGASVLGFVNSSIDYHNLMKMGFFVFYLFFILQYEKDNAIRTWVVLGVTTVLIVTQVVLANVSYHKINMAYEKSYGTLIRIADRIEQTEGAEDCEQILVLGTLPGSEAYSVNLPPDMTGTTDGFILRADDEVVGQSVLCSALNDYCGTNYQFLAGEAKQSILEKLDVDSLGNWPEKNSIRVLDGVIVIKLGD